MIFLILAIICSVAITIIMRIGTERVKGNRSMLAMNYLMCLALGIINAGPGNLFPSVPMLGATIGFGAINGALFLGGFVMLQFCIKRNGMVLSSLFMKLGLLVPLLISIVFFRENPSLLQWLGFVMAIAAIILINSEDVGTNKGGRFGITLIILLLLGGSCDGTNKIFEELFPVELSPQFLLYTFAFALIYCLLLVIKERERIGKSEIIYGFLIGIPNYYCSRFLLLSLSRVPAVIVYPSFSVATILFVTLIGIFTFKEKLSPRRWISLGIIAAALVLLNI